MPPHSAIWIVLAALFDAGATIGLAQSYRRLKQFASPESSWLGQLCLEPILGLAVTMGAFLFTLFLVGGTHAIRVSLAVAYATALCTSYGAYNRARVNAPLEARRAAAAFAVFNALLLAGTLTTAAVLYLLFIQRDH